MENNVPVNKRQMLRVRKGVVGFQPVDEKSTKTVSFKVTETEYNNIQRYVKRKKIVNMSEWFRNAIFEMMKK